MAVAKKYVYRIQYIDNTYQLVEWTKAQLKDVARAMMSDTPAVLVDDDVFRVSDIRAIVHIPPQPELTEAEKKAQAEQESLEEWGFVDQATAEWLKMQGVKIGGGH